MPDKIASKIYLFADDATLYRQIEDKSDVTGIHENLQSLEIWTCQSLLSFKIDKCVHLTKGTTTKEVQLEIDMGICLDNKLTFETHITKKPIRQTA